MGRGRSWVVPVVLVVAAAVLLPGRAAGRELYWRSLAVEARLAGDGSLWVAEEHAMVFDGDWNGGERRFRLGPGQAIELRGVARIEPEGGRAVALVEGDLGRIDRYAWAGGETLRWRSRLPSDPPFAGEEITYVIEYRLTGVLLPLGGDVYRLDHDFAFPDRPGRIERFRLDLELDPAFAPLDELPARLERTALWPGESEVVTARLRYLLKGRPGAAAPPPAPLAVRLGLFAAAAAAMAGLLLRFKRRETRAGRFWGRLPQPPGLDRAWIEEHLLDLPPEEVGALWDRSVGAPEVAAVLARLVAEGKLEGEVAGGSGGRKATKDDLRLRLLVGRERFSGFERELIDKLFYGRREQVTTSKLREHYRESGFDPAEIIRPALEARIRQRAETAPAGRAAPGRWPTAVLFLAVLGLFAGELWLNPSATRVSPVKLGLLLAGLYGLAAAFAAGSRWRVDRLGLGTRLFGAPAAAVAAVAAWVAFPLELAGLRDVLGLGAPDSSPPGLLGALALALAPLAVWRSITNLASGREAPTVVARRQRLLQARRYLQGQLRHPHPDLDDAWFPYLLAFGLSTAVDRWATAFGAERTELAAAAEGFAGATGSTGGAARGWTGGGGRFGGAGASATWAAAASAMAAGVSPPSSSGSDSGDSGGGGGGGGGSSGGGGGGGW